MDACKSKVFFCGGCSSPLVVMLDDAGLMCRAPSTPAAEPTAMCPTFWLVVMSCLIAYAVSLGACM